MKRTMLVFMLMIVMLTGRDLFPQLSPAINVQSGSRSGFEPNFGQVADFNGKKADNVIFRSSNDGFDIFVTKTGISYVIKNFTQVFKERGFSQNGYNSISHPSDKRGESVLNWARVDLDLLNANIKPENIEYSVQLPGYTNYYYPHIPDGVLFVPAYKFVKIKNVYQGIDWVWKIDSEGILHHEFEVSENADYKKMQFKIKWADVKISNSGYKVNFSTPTGVIEDGAILAYDESGPVNTTYKYNNNILSYSINSPVNGKLVIDPPLARLWATFYGGGNNDYGKAITTDKNGNVFLTGYSSSSDFPTQNPGDSAYFQGTRASSEDAFIIKFNNLGVR